MVNGAWDGEFGAWDGETWLSGAWDGEIGGAWDGGLVHGTVDGAWDGGFGAWDGEFFWTNLPFSPRAKILWCWRRWASLL